MPDADGPEADRSPAFSGRVIAVPETRQLDVLANLLARRGAEVLRCPLVAILDTPDTDAVVAWLEQAIAAPPDLIVFYTGEGIERLLGFAERAGLRAEFVAMLGRVEKLCRGPKPKRALKKVGLEADLDAAAPTTEGIIETLAALDLGGKRVGVQLYADADVPELAALLTERGAAVDWVTPYAYASGVDDARVLELIDTLAAGRVDAITFTSQSQVARLFKLARSRGIDARLTAGLARTCVAAVGPVVARTLEDEGIRVDATPGDQYFMKPLVSALEAALGASRPAT